KYPVWSADSRRVVFQSSRDGDLAIFWQAADGTAGAERLTKPEKDTSHAPTAMSPDGNTLLYEADKGPDPTAWAFSLKHPRASMLQDVRASNIAISPTFSPDGRWIAVSSNRLTDLGPDRIGAATVFVMRFPPMGAKYLVARAAHPAWSPDGNELFFRRAGA